MHAANLHSCILLPDLIQLFFIKHHIMTSVKLEVELHSFFTPAVGRGEWLCSRPGRPTPRGIAASTIRQVAGWNQQAFWTLWRRGKSLLLPWLEPTIVAYKLITCYGVVFCRGLCEMMRSWIVSAFYRQEYAVKHVGACKCSPLRLVDHNARVPSAKWASPVREHQPTSHLLNTMPCLISNWPISSTHKEMNPVGSMCWTCRHHELELDVRSFLTTSVFRVFSFFL